MLMSACTVTQEPFLTTEIPTGPVRGFQIQIHTTEENAVAHDVAAGS